MHDPICCSQLPAQQMKPPWYEILVLDFKKKYAIIIPLLAKILFCWPTYSLMVQFFSAFEKVGRGFYFFKKQSYLLNVWAHTEWKSHWSKDLPKTQWWVHLELSGKRMPLGEKLSINISHAPLCARFQGGI